ncbi:MAG TPA: diaminopimelate epimerase [Candidatus Dormibacteraeota bacterium]|nr:diaminopimelate epimerase [Candidatus Dormibacteraeota bacterium]
MTDISFTKAHALGNDFLLVEEAALGGRSPGELAIRICDRHTGAGADGLVPLAPAGPGRWKFRIFNADGGEAGLSGNAMRCASAWLASRTASAEPGLQLTLETQVGAKRQTLLGRRGNAWLFQGEIARPEFAPEMIPFHPPKVPGVPAVDFPLPVGDETIHVTPLWMGNPQCIVFVDSFDTIDWRGLGPEIEHHPFFPERANAGFVHVISAQVIEARFWERGVGHTLASGTGTCACAVAAALHGKTDRNITVFTEIGQAEVHWREDDDVVELTGPAELVFDGIYHLPD